MSTMPTNNNPLAFLGGMFQSPYAELLTPEQQKASKQQAMMQAGFAALANSGWSPQRRSMGQIIGQAGMAGMQGSRNYALDAVQAGQVQRQIQQQGQPKWEERRIGDQVVQGYAYPDGRFEPIGVGSHFAPSNNDGMAQRERKIRDLMEQRGLSVADATAVVDGHQMFQVDPNGNPILFDKVTNTARILEPNYPTPQPTSPPPKVNADDLAIDAGAGVGVKATAQGLWNQTLGQAPFLPVFQEAESAAQGLRFFERDMIKALASSSRPPVVEQERILAAIPNAMDWRENPRVAQQKLAEAVDLLGVQYAADLQDSNDPSMGREVRRQAQVRAREINRIISTTLKPDAAKQWKVHFENPGAAQGQQGAQGGVGSLVDKWRTR